MQAHQLAAAPIVLRPYQERALGEIQTKHAEGIRRVLLVAFCGAGKTTIAGAAVRYFLGRGKRILVIAHRRELIQQAYDRLLAMGVPEHELGVVMAGDRRTRPHARVQVASLQTLSRRSPGPADVIVYDEAHHAVAPQATALLTHYPHAFVLGLTATPYRTDGRGLGEVFDDIVVAATPRELIEGGYMLEPRILTVPPAARPDLSKVKIERGDYDERQLERVMNQASLVGNLVDHWQKHAEERRTLVFAVSVSHSRHIVERFRHKLIAAEHVDGATPKQERDAIFARLQSGETKIVSNVAIATEGTDIPAVKCVVLARPTQSTGLYIQQIGRALRPWRGQLPLVLDHAGCALAHGLPHEERTFFLDSTSTDEARRATVRKPNVCSACHAVFPPDLPECPECGKPVRVDRPVVEEVPAELVEVDAQDVGRKRLFWRRWCLVSLLKGYKPEYPIVRYSREFGEPPPRGMPRPRGGNPDQLRRELLGVLRQEHGAWAEVEYFTLIKEHPPE